MAIKLLNEFQVMEIQEEIAIKEMKENAVNSIFISGNTASSKNSKRMITLRNGKSLLINSESVMNYKKIAVPQFKAKKNQFLEIIQGKPLPLKIELTFIRDSKRLFDFINAAQILFDLMQECEWIPEDNYLNVLPSFNPVVVVDKSKAGCLIKIL